MDRRRLRPLAVLAVAGCLSGAVEAGDRGDDLRLSFLSVTEGIRGGIVGPMVRRRIQLGYDWQEGEYRVVVRQGAGFGVTPRYLVRSLTTAEYEAILRGLLERGIDTIPPQLEPEGDDVYGLDVGLELHAAGVLWANRASGGCTSVRAENPPDDRAKRTFAGIVAFVVEAVESAPLEPGCELDAGFAVVFDDVDAGQAFLTAMDHVLQGPLRAEVDLRRIEVDAMGSDYAVRFAWRGVQDLQHAPQRKRRSRSHMVVIDGRSFDVKSEVTMAPEWPPEAALAHRAHFLEERPDLPPRIRRLVAEGWVVQGMTKEMVQASWGKATAESPGSWSYDRCGVRVDLRFDGEVLARRP